MVIVKENLILKWTGKKADVRRWDYIYIYIDK